MKKTTKNKGFTLVELIVVIAIIIILAAMAVPRLTKYIDSAREASEVATADAIYKATVTALIYHEISGKNLPDSGIDSGIMLPEGELKEAIISSVAIDSSKLMFGVTYKDEGIYFNPDAEYWGVFLPVNKDYGTKDGKLVPSGDIYIIPPKPRPAPSKNIYKNGAPYAYTPPVDPESN